MSASILHILSLAKSYPSADAKVPGAPERILCTKHAAASLSLDWNVSDSGGAPILSYELQVW